MIMVPIREHLALPPPQPVEPLRAPHEQPLHPPRQRPPILRLGNQVQMIALDRILNQPEAESLASPRERLHENLPRRHPPQRWQTLPDADGDVHGEPSREGTTRPVSDERARSRGLATRPGPRAAASLEWEKELSRLRSFHLIRH